VVDATEVKHATVATRIEDVGATVDGRGPRES
jgi:hypothetical protein